MSGDMSSFYLGGRLNNQTIEQKFDQFYQAFLNTKIINKLGFYSCSENSFEKSIPEEVIQERVISYGTTNSWEIEASNPEGKGYIDVYGSAEAFVQLYTTLFVDVMRFAIEIDDAAIVFIDGSGSKHSFFQDIYSELFLEGIMLKEGYYDIDKCQLSFPEEKTTYICEKALECTTMWWMIGINNTRLDKDVFLPKIKKKINSLRELRPEEYSIFERGKATMVIQEDWLGPYLLYEAKEELQKKGKSFIWQPDSLVGYPV